MPITIHPLATHAEIHAVEQLQREAWGVPDVEVVPLHVLITAARTAGCCWARSTAIGWPASSSASWA